MALQEKSQELIVLGASALGELLTPKLAIDALQRAYADLHAAPDDGPQTLAFATPHGKIHVKACLAPAAGRYFAAKINANYPDNAARLGLPTIQGVIALFCRQTGRPLALLQSGELTARRTAATAALAAKYGARPGAHRLAVVGAGAQARAQIEAMASLFALTELKIFDIDGARAENLAAWATDTIGIEAATEDGVVAAVRDADIIVTITPSRAAFLRPEMIVQGAFVAAMGADNQGKQEIDPELFRVARVILDDIAHCAIEGDLAHALAAGAIVRGEVVADLAMLAAGAARARLADDDIVLFDSTGSGLQDVAAAGAAYEAAVAIGAGAPVSLA